MIKAKMFLIAILVLMFTGCDLGEPGLPRGEYELEFPFLYSSPFGIAKVDYIKDGTGVSIGKDSFTIVQNATGKSVSINEPVYKRERLTDKMAEELSKETADLMGLSKLSEYKSKNRYTVYDNNGEIARLFPYNDGDIPANISLYKMDGEIWFAPYWDNVSGTDPAGRRHDFIARLKKKAG